MNKWFFSLIPLFFLLLISSFDAYALTNLENKDIIAESSNGFNNYFLVIEFGDYEFTKKGKPIPQVNSAFLDINGHVIDLDNLRPKIMGNSFVVRSDDVLIYAQGKGNDQYQINLYILDGTGLNRITLMTNDVSEEKMSIIKDEEILPDMSVIIKHNDRTFWQQNYVIEIKVIDKNQNTTPAFHESLGAIENADVTVVLTDEENLELTNLTGKTNDSGYWMHEFFIEQNLVHGGKYFVEVTTSYLGITNIQTLETFIVAEVPEDKD